MVVAPRRMENSSMEKKWYKLDDQHVLMHWVSPVDSSDEAWVSPDFYEENGSPIDFLGNNMKYQGTYINDL